MSDRKPWDVEPKLAEQRLRLVMEVFVQVRKELAPLYTKGDSPWSHGCRAYSWILDRMEQLQKDLETRGETWLKTQRKNNFFLLKFEGVLVRIYRGDPEKPNERALRIGQQLQANLPGILGDDGEESTNEWVWMLSYESNPMPWSAKDAGPTDGLVIAVSICQARSTASYHAPADTRFAWTVPVGIGDVALTAGTPDAPKPYDPGRPAVKPKDSSKRKKDGAGDGDRDA